MGSLFVNDIHSQLNRTRVSRLVEPANLDEVIGIVRDSRKSGLQLSVCGGRHAMGGQQFGADTTLIDMRRYVAIKAFDIDRGIITAGAGIQWPDLIAACAASHNPDGAGWGIRQKQTGADRLTLGGALSANVHGRGLHMPPIIADVEAFTLIDANGEARHCSRSEYSGLFNLAIGGYGLFGLITEVSLRLMPRLKLERRVQIKTIDEVIDSLGKDNDPDALFGDFQYSIDEHSPDFLNRGVLSTYHKIDDDLPIPSAQRHLSGGEWQRLLYLAHTDRATAFEEYANYYLATNRQRYWSDDHQLGYYSDNYHQDIDHRTGAPEMRTEMITEIYVPPTMLPDFMEAAADLLRGVGMPVIYGSIRMVERDNESFLAWAREPWACIIFNLCVTHSPSGFATAQRTFCGLIDLAISRQGSYYLTYHRWASRAQVEICHPRFREFLAQKSVHDPSAVFTSDWYRHYRALLAE